MAKKSQKQLRIAGTQSKAHDDIDAAAEVYVDIRDKRMALTEEEHAAQKVLVETMTAHKLKVYRCESLSPQFIVTMTEGEAKAKVSKVKSEPADGAQDGE